MATSCSLQLVRCALLHKERTHSGVGEFHVGSWKPSHGGPSVQMHAAAASMHAQATRRHAHLRVLLDAHAVAVMVTAAVMEAERDGVGGAATAAAGRR